MKKKLCIFIFGLIGTTSVIGQSLDKRYIDNWILNVFPKITIDENTLYILNGMAYKNDSIEQVLKKYKPDDLITLNALDKSHIDSSSLLKPRSSIIYMNTKGMMTEKDIKKVFKKAKERFAKRRLLFNDIHDSRGEPVLIINGVQIINTDCYVQINNIVVSNIIGINYIDQPVSERIYGTNGINGLIEIKTK